MTKEQLIQSIEELTQAMYIIVRVAGIGGDHVTGQITDGISQQRSKLEKRLRDMEYAERKALRDTARAEALDPRTMPHHKE